MAYKYTYDDFQSELAASGLAGEFSAADLKLAQQNPDAGMSILNYKKDWHNATTDEARALANKGAEAVRSSYGEYTGGSDGGNFYINEMSPGTFSYADAPSFSSNYTGEVADTYNSVKNYGDFTYDPYSGKWDSQIQDMGNQLYNYGPFEYSASTDPLYAQYRKEYAREGRRATEDTLGIAAAASGGLPSSYAATAAAQAGNYYASQLTDKIPELYKLAYQKYLSDYQLKSSTLSALQSLDQSDYTKWLNGVNLDKDIYNDKYGRLVDAAQMAQNLENTDWSRYQDNLAQYNTDRGFNYNQYLDELTSRRQEQQDARDLAAMAYDVGDTSFLNNMGINTDNDPRAWEQRMQEEQMRQQQEQRAIQNAIDVYETTGDASLLAALGYTPDMVGINNRALAERGEYGATNVSDQNIMQMQMRMGVTVDGIWGPESMAASGGLTADEAYEAFKNGTLPEGVGGGYYGGGYDGYDGGYQNAVYTGGPATPENAVLTAEEKANTKPTTLPMVVSSTPNTVTDKGNTPLWSNLPSQLPTVDTDVKKKSSGGGSGKRTRETK